MFWRSRFEMIKDNDNKLVKVLRFSEANKEAYSDIQLQPVKPEDIVVNGVYEMTKRTQRGIFQMMVKVIYLEERNGIPYFTYERLSDNSNAGSHGSTKFNNKTLYGVVAMKRAKRIKR